MNGELEGFGVIHYTNTGDRYEGCFTKTIPNGRGMLYCLNGNEVYSNYVDGILHGIRAVFESQ